MGNCRSRSKQSARSLAEFADGSTERHSRRCLAGARPRELPEHAPKQARKRSTGKTGYGGPAVSHPRGSSEACTSEGEAHAEGLVTSADKSSGDAVLHDGNPCVLCLPERFAFCIIRSNHS